MELSAMKKYHSIIIDFLVKKNQLLLIFIKQIDDYIQFEYIFFKYCVQCLSLSYY